jgi:hypothetical protein
MFLALGVAFVIVVLVFRRARKKGRVGDATEGLTALLGLRPQRQGKYVHKPTKGHPWV